MSSLKDQILATVLAPIELFTKMVGAGLVFLSVVGLVITGLAWNWNLTFVGVMVGFGLVGFVCYRSIDWLAEKIF